MLHLSEMLVVSTSLLIVLSLGVFGQTNLGRTGLIGGTGGSYFDDLGPQNSRNILGIKALRIRYGNQIDSIQATYLLPGRAEYTAPRRGGTGGTEIYIQFASGEVITEVNGWTNHGVVDRLMFITTTRTYGPYGITGNTPFRVQEQVIGFYGRVGAIMDAIGFYYRNFCTSTTCQNGGTCVEGTGSATSCTCQLGYGGTDCGVDQDFCTNTTCLNRGTCVEGIGTATSCTCIHGFNGTDCGVDLPFCTNTTCLNGGTCMEGIGNFTSCTCIHGFNGTNCEEDLDFCTPTTCLNEGTCIELRGNLTSCNCVAGFSGENCEQDLDFCQPNTCQNSGTCLEGRGTVTMCDCAPGYAGSSCENDVEYCSSSSCRNGGTCMEGPGRTTSCQCLQDFSGPMCSTRIEAPSVPCPAEVEPNWMLNYRATQPGETAMHQCSEIQNSGTMSGSTGSTSRLCLGNGEWGAVDTFSCRQEAIQQVAMEVQEVFSQEVVSSQDLERVLEGLVNATELEGPETVSLFPQDLETTNNILDMTLNHLLEDLSSNPDNPFPLSTGVVEVIDNILEPNNEAGWGAFEENEVGSEMILSNAENYGQYFARALMNENVSVSSSILETMAITRENIVVQADLIDQDNVGSILFPEGIELNQRDMFGSAQSILPRSFLLDRGASEITISAVNIRMDNINKFLPNDGLNATRRPATSIMATQLVTPEDADNETTSAPPGEGRRPSFRFTTKEFKNGEIVSDPLCAFWKFTEMETGGFWSQEGVTTEVTFHDKDKGTYDVICKSTHLTSFAVMLDVNMALSEVEIQVLSIITIIGCSISVIFLFVTIIFFIFVIGKAMFTNVHYFIHLNLAIALLLGYVVFLAGVDTAVGNRIGCAFVAALLHYLFTAVFCWMLCEGIMLYLMLVVVFSRVTNKWWLFFLLGWGKPCSQEAQ